MSVERVLQICTASLAMLATVLLGMGEHNTVLPLMTIAVAASSVYFCDVRGWIQLNTPMANLAGMAAVVASLNDYRTAGLEKQLLALANLLIYLQCVLLYRRKEPRVYWMLALLSLLQVAVATVLNLSFWFGVLMVLYMLLAMFTIMLFLIYREQQSHAASRSETTAAPLAALDPWRTAPQHNGAVFTPRTRATVPPRDVLRGLMRQVGRMAAATLVLTSLVFVLVPRTGERAAWGERTVETKHVVGFSETVTLGELGEIVENPEEVLQMRFFDADNGTPYYLKEVPLLRGTVLTRYQNSKWRLDRLTSRAEIPTPQSDQRGLVRQEVQVSRLDTPTLFAIFPVLTERKDAQIQYDSQQDRLTRGQGASFPFEYTLLTNGLYGGRQLPVIPCAFEPNPQEFKFDLLQEVDDQRHRRLKQLAADVVRDKPADDIVVRAVALERQLRDLGGFSYTLSPPQRDPNLDPLEDFIFKNKKGHCEYFASALTLMLRSVGIPARMVVGFKGADWNPLTGYYHVRQLHAHTWVEVYLRPEQFPKGTMEFSHAQIPTREWEAGGWLRLDPTPAFEGADHMPPTDRFPSLRHLLDYADYLWAGYVLSMDANRQRETVFEPIKQGTQGIVSVVFDKELWRTTFINIGKLLSGERLDDEGLWFSWRAAFVSCTVLLLLVIMYRGVVWLVRQLWHWGRPRQANILDLKDAEVEFYRRLESILAQRLLVRLPTQTQREFALRAGDALDKDPLTTRVASIPRNIAELFYRVRFGRAPLGWEQVEDVDRALADLAAALFTAKEK